MSFIYAEKREEYTLIYSDTKLTFNQHAALNWGKQTYDAMCTYGLIKSIIVRDNCCISFAGNNIMLAHDLIKQSVEHEEITEKQLIDNAFDIYLSAAPDDIEFIICTADEKEETHITCIKERKITYDNQNAWIGSPIAFHKMQEIRMQDKKIGLGDPFERSIHECGDLSVGGFPILTVYSTFEHGFFYTERISSTTGRAHNTAPGEIIDFYDTAADGGYTTYQHWSNEEVRIDFLQGDFSILYTNKYRLSEPDEYTKYFLLPIPIKTSEKIILPVRSS